MQRTPKALAAAMEHDLTAEFCLYLDDHMIVQILDFLTILGIHDPHHIIRAKLEVLTRTQMLDFLRELLQKAVELGVPGVSLSSAEDAAADKQKVLQKVQTLKAACGALMAILDNEQLLASLRAEGKFTLHHLGQAEEEDQKVTEAHVDSLRDLAQLYYNIGQYWSAAQWLQAFRELTPDPEKSYWALWGQLAANICSMNTAGAIADCQTLKQLIDSRNDSGRADQATSLHHRTWLAHWATFLYANDAGREALIRLLFGVDHRDTKGGGYGGNDYRMINAIQLRSPYILRYLCAAVVVQERFQLQRELIRALQETPEYRDPMTDFVRALYIDHDVNAAQRALKGVFLLSATDFVLSWDADKLRANCRMMLFKMFCNVHRSVDIDEIAGYLGIDEEQQRAEHAQRQREKQSRNSAAKAAEEKEAGGASAEQPEAEAAAEADEEEAFVPREAQAQLLELIRATHVSAKIDSISNRLLMGGGAQSVYQTLIYRTRSLIERSGTLTTHVERRLNDVHHRD